MLGFVIRTWDNFEYRENVHVERIGDKVKFRSITMALWVRHGWRISLESLKQSMWSPTREFLDPLKVSCQAFDFEPREVRATCVLHHRFSSFKAAFPDQEFKFSPAMPKINIIDCKLEGATSAYAFAPSMYSESSTAGNIGVFDDLALKQMGLEKEDIRWDNLLTLWWGGLKTEVQMLSMQGHGIGANRSFETYKHLMPGLALWHLRFNYLKMIWELFYPGGSSTERSILQWAADHWHRDKTTRPTDFHSLEDLTIHSCRSRVIAIIKPWIQEQAPRLNIHNAEELGKWLSKLPSTRWLLGMRWLDDCMNEERLSRS